MRAAPVRSCPRATQALATIRAAGTYGELERLAGVTDRVAFWEPFATNENAARRELMDRAFTRLMEGTSEAQS